MKGWLRRRRQAIALRIAPWLLKDRLVCPASNGYECVGPECIVYGCEQERRDRAAALVASGRVEIVPPGTIRRGPITRTPGGYPGSPSP